MVKKIKYLIYLEEIFSNSLKLKKLIKIKKIKIKFEKNVFYRILYTKEWVFYFIYYNFNLNSLCRLLIKNGFSDMTVKVENEYIKTIKCLLCGRNKVLMNLINDKMFNGCLELYDKCTKESFFILESYYSGGKIEINNRNCIDIMKICIYYNEINLLKDCEKYVLNHINEEMIIKIFYNKEILSCIKLKLLKKYAINYLIKNGYKLLKEDIIMNLPFDVFKSVIEKMKIFEGDESILLQNFIKYYKQYNNIYIKNDINNFLMKIDYNKILLNDLDDDEIAILNEFENIKAILDNKKNIKNIINIVECSDVIKDIVYKYYFKINDMTEINSINLIYRK